MTSAPPPGTGTGALARATETIRRLREELDERSARTELAVVGIGLRLPGGIDTLDGLWQALLAGRDLTGLLPLARTGPFAREWEGLPRRGGFLDEVLDFDAEYFGISPREARALDPQHRLLLEVSAEALDDAGLTARTRRGATVGLTVGVSHQDYRDWEPPDADQYWATGNGHCFAAGRVAYCLGLDGPAVAVDTACSSSLVAVHSAGAALAAGDVDIALAGGVNLILSPRSTRLLGPGMGALSPDGRCRPFDGRANGFTRGEGAVVLVLRRLSDAIGAGDRVHAVIRGSAINQDGRTAGFTAPSVPAQVAVVRAALRRAGVDPAAVGLVEAHGTGTSLGDPIEMAALVEALDGTGTRAPLRVASVKANVGHLEAAAGAAGLLSAVLALRHGRIPPLAHFRHLNPRIDLAGTRIEIPSRVIPWDTPASQRVAGVSSFGMSGTNAHVVLGAAPDGAAPDGAVAPPVPGFGVSARTETALRALAGAYADRLEILDDTAYPAFAYSATHGRGRHPMGVWVPARDRSAAVAALRALASAGAPQERTDPADWPAPELPRTVVTLPAYPWQRKRYAPEHTTGEAAHRAHPVTGSVAEHHEVSWVPVAVPTPVPARVVLVGAAPDGATDDQDRDPRDDLDALVALARARGHRTTLVRARTGDLAEALAQVARAGDRIVVVPAPAPGASPPPAVPPVDAVVRDAAEQCALVRAVVGAAPAGGRVHVLTRGTQRCSASDAVVLGGSGALHGLGAVLALDEPAWGGLVDLPVGADAGDLATALDAALAEGDEDLLAVRAGRVLAARLVAATEPPQVPVRPDGAYLVTGGAGAVGRALVTELCERGAGRVAVVGRRPAADLDPSVAESFARLTAAGTTVTYEQGDVTEPATVTAAVDRLRAEGLALRGVVHAAGDLRSGTGGAGPAADLSVKLGGALALQAATAGDDLDLFVVVSSLSAVVGTSGYQAYSAANAAMDLVVAHRAATGLPGLSLRLGPWGEGGMVSAEELEALERGGVGAVTATAGRRALTAASPGPSGALVVGPLDIARLAAVVATRRPRALLSGSVTAPADEPGTAATGSPATADPAEPTAASVAEHPVLDLASLPPAARRRRARDTVRRHVAAVLEMDDPDGVPDRRGFYDLGLDSMMAVDLVRAVGEAVGVVLPVSDVFAHGSVAELGDHLAAVAGLAGAPRPVPAPPAADVLPATVPGAPAGPSAARDGAARDGAARDAGAEAIAVVGMAGRFPGADSVEELWDLLVDGRDGVTTVPADRWDAAALSDRDPLSTGTVRSDRIGAMRGLDRFDAEFFGIPAREAQNLDPQQRLLLESTWHALEHANLPAASLRGSATGVFVGVSQSDYARLLESHDLAGIDAYFGTGTALNAVAGRIAYVLGTQGPALAVDTACSSSLVAVHLAVSSLRSGESDVAIAAGVNVIAHPVPSVAVSRAHMLSPQGRCAAFSAEADGFVRAEAAVSLVLKPLRRAEADGDRVLGVILGTAVNSDGASSGLTVPNGAAQREVIQAALRDARVHPWEVDYLEAHGTGTSLGDPVEVDAAWDVLGEGRPAPNPLRLGSVKSNVGHCESAAGAVGLVKVLLSLQHGSIPANLHVGTPNPHIPWHDMAVEVVDRLTSWPTGARRRVAGVSAFGFSGTNAHLVVGEAPPAAGPEPAGPGEGPLVLPLSAPDPDGLARLSAAWSRALASADPATVPAMVRTAAVGRHHHDLRRVVTGSGADDLVAGLAAPLPGPAAGGRRAPRVALLFTGQGSQYVGMGRGLHRAHPVFRAELDACREVLSDLMGRDLYEVMWAGTDADLARTSLTQPSLVAVELALAALWQSWGVDPVVALGHSIGEVTAAIHAGVLSREDGLTLVHHRARLMQSAEPGAMLAVAADPGRVTELLTAGGLDLAAVNGPKAVVVAGPDEEVSAFAAVLTREGVRSRRLAVSHAFHSRMMDPVLGELRTVAARFSHAEAAFPLVSNVTGDTAPAGRYGPDYWPAQVRGTVRFADGLRRLVEHEVDTVLEVGPGGTLAALALAADVVERERALTSLRRGADEPTTALDAAARLYGIGQGLDWRAVHAGTRGSADVPRYPFARTTHWTPAPARAAAAAAAKVAGAARSPGPHWGVPLRSPGLSGRVFTALRSQTFPAYLTDHRLYGTVVTPAASHLATVLSAVAATGGAPPTLTDIVCPRALVVEGSAEHELHVVLGDDRLRVASLLDAGAGTWQDHVTARLGDAVTPAPWPGHDRADFAVTAERHLTGERFYACFRDLGYTLGPSFRWITDLWIGDCECLVRLAPPELPDRREDYVLHPGLIDSCFQSIAGFLVDDGAREAPSLAIPFSVAAFVPREVGRVPQADELYAWVRVRAAENLPNGRQRVAAADIRLELSDGTAVLDVTDLRVRHASRDTLTSATGSGAPHRFRVEWVEHPAPAPAPAATADAAPLTVELISVDGAGDDLGTALATAGHAVARTRPETLAPAAGRVDVVLDVVSGSTAEGEAGGALAVRDAVARLASRLRSRAVGATYAVVVEGGATVAPLREAVWGMLASLEAEDPARRLLRVESAATAAPGAVAEAVVDAVRRGVPEPRLRVSGSAVSVARLSRAAPEPAVPVLSGGVLVTGGTGALGLSTAAWAVRRGAASVTLMSRGGEHAGVLDTEGPAPLCVVRGDVTDLADCRRALAAARRTAPVGHVFHLAGSTADGEFGSLDDADFAAAFAAKALGADVLLTALSEGADPLPSVVLYSSVASCLGSPGQTAYAAANGYLTGLAERLRTSGAPVTSVLWGPWVPVAGTGLAATAAAGAAVERAGVRVLDDDAAHAALDAVARSAAAATVVVDLAGYPARVRGTRRAALVAGLAVDTAGADAGSGPGVGAVPGAAPGHGPAPGPPAGWLALRVAGSDAGRRRAIVTEAVAGVVSDVLGRPVPPGETRGLMDLGLDSIMSIDVRARLSHALGVTLPATIAFDHPTLAALSAELERAWLPGPAPLPAGGGAGRGERSDDDLADLLAAVEADLSAEV